MNRTTKLLIAAPFAALLAQPASAATIELRGTIQTICEMRFDVASAPGETTSSAGLTVFCNAPDGARISGELLDGAEGGYQISTGGASFVATPGSAFELKNYNTAFAGFEQVQIAQVGGGAPVSPVLMFEIVAAD
jgi:hypothetical protein